MSESKDMSCCFFEMQNKRSLEKKNILPYFHRKRNLASENIFVLFFFFQFKSMATLEADNLFVKREA